MDSALGNCCCWCCCCCRLTLDLLDPAEDGDLDLDPGLALWGREPPVAEAEEGGNEVEVELAVRRESTLEFLVFMVQELTILDFVSNASCHAILCSSSIPGRRSRGRGGRSCRRRGRGRLPRGLLLVVGLEALVLGGHALKKEKQLCL